MSRPEISGYKIDLFMKDSGNTNKKRTQRDYNLGFKLGVVSQVEKGEMTYKQAQKAF